MLKIKKLFFQIENNIDLVIKQDTPLGKDLFNMLLQQHYADIAMLLARLDQEYQVALFKKLPEEVAIDVFEELSETVQAGILVNLGQEKATMILKNVSSDELADLFDYLPDEDLKKYLRLIQRKQRHQIISRLNFEPESAGRIMNSEVITLQKDFTVKKSVRLLQRIGEKKELLQRIYVTDNQNMLVGYINLDDLMVNKPETPLRNIIQRNELIIDAHEDQEDVAKQIHHYGLLMAPIVDSQNHFLGVITADDVLDILEEEASEDVYKMSGITPVEHTYFETSMLRFVWQRGVWLIPLLLLQSVSGFIMQGYEQVVKHCFIISMFLTMLMGTGGNAGNQSSALVIRGLATGEITRKNGVRVLLKEFGVSAILATILVSFAFLRVYLQRNSFMEAVAVSVALFLVVLIAMFLGTLLPLILERFNLDPAHSAAPFLATIMDIVTVLLFCFVVSRLLGVVVVTPL
jgi:magnesium transporter